MVGKPGFAVWTLAVLTVAMLILTMVPYVSPYDEGIILSGAARVQAGDVPYRDFWTIYGPGGFYALAWLFDLFGDQVIVGRIFDLCMRTMIVLCAYQIVIRHQPRFVAFACAIMVLALLIVLPFYTFPIFPALAFILAAALATQQMIDGKWPQTAAIGAGLALGMATLFRHDLGFYGSVAFGLMALGSFIRDRNFEHLWSLARFTAGLAIVLAPAAAALLVAVPFGDLLSDLIIFPAQVYPKVRSLPFPSIAGLMGNAFHMRPVGLFSFQIYAPLIALAAGASFAAGRRAQRPVPSIRPEMLAFLLFLTALFFIKGLVRVSPIHMASSVIVAIVLMGVIAPRAMKATPHVLLWVAALLVIVVPMLGPVAASFREGFHSTALLADRCRHPAVPRLTCLATDPDRVAVIRYLREHGTGGRAVYFGTGRHDKVFVNDVILYFLSDSRPATKWHELHPGLQTTAAIQSAMLEEFKARPPVYVVLDSAWDNVTEPNDSAVSSGITLLDDYLRDRYAPVASYGAFTIFAPKGRSSSSGIETP
ncbi:MAG: hypothetical protein K8R18_16925 [Parvibaculum sp.]|nr:hypothetical protein [Parvibaculum sp.]